MSILAILLVVAVVAAGVVAIVLATRKPQTPSDSTAEPTARRLIVFILLFVLVVLGAIGLAGLLGRLFGAHAELVGGAHADLARSLAFTLIAGPLAVLLWWIVWRRANAPAERAAAGWGLYVAGMWVVSLITAVSSLLITAAALIGGDWQPQTLATGLVWAGVWAWHRWMAAHPDRGPLQLTTVAPTLTAAYGLIIGTGGAVTALGVLLDTAIRGFAMTATLGRPWWQGALAALVWAVGGGLVWWWHWVRENVRGLQDALAHVLLVLVGILGASILTLVGAGIALDTLLRLAFNPVEPTVRILEPLGGAIAAAALGALVWIYHDRLVHGHSPAIGRTARLVASGVTLVAAASGVGVIVNSLLAALGAPLVGAATRDLLLAGISSLVVGGPLWWLNWRSARHLDPAHATTGRRIYLIAVFGLSAVSALITLLIIGYQAFEFTLEATSGGSLIDRVRAPLGVFVATGLVAAYHFSVWRQDRSVLAETPRRQRAIGWVILVAAADADRQKRVIEAATGAAVTVWQRSDAVAVPAAGAGTDVPPAGPSTELLSQALVGVTGKRVLVVTGLGSQVDVIPLRD